MVSLYINNATDERAQYFHSTGLFEYNFSSSGSSDPLASSYDHYHRVYTNRPMEYGVRFKYSWGD